MTNKTFSLNFPNSPVDFGAESAAASFTVNGVSGGTLVIDINSTSASKLVSVEDGEEVVATVTFSNAHGSSNSSVTIIASVTESAPSLPIFSISQVD